MSSDTLTFALDGEVPLDAFASAMDHFSRLVTALSGEVAANVAIDWTVEALEVGSAVATVRGDSANAEYLSRVVRAYETVGRTLEEGAAIPYSPKVNKEARALLQVLDGRVTAVRFETANVGATIYGRAQSNRTAIPTARTARGAIKGRIQTLTSRHRLRFTLYDTLFDRAVTCYLEEGKEEMMRDAWGRLSVVEGRVSRDAVTGRPVAIRHVQQISFVPDVRPGSYRDARGVAPVGAGALSPEEAIRRVRDA